MFKHSGLSLQTSASLTAERAESEPRSPGGSAPASADGPGGQNGESIQRHKGEHLASRGRRSGGKGVGEPMLCLACQKKDTAKKSAEAIRLRSKVSGTHPSHLRPRASTQNMLCMARTTPAGPGDHSNVRVTVRMVFINVCVGVYPYSHVHAYVLKTMLGNIFNLI